MEPQSNLTTTEKPRLHGIGDLLSESWNIFQKHFRLIIGVVVPGIIVGVAAGALFLFDDTIVISLASLVGGLVSIWVTVSLLYAISERDRITVAEALRKGGQRFFSYLWISLLSGFIVLGGFLLFIIPGIILAIWFSLALYILAAEDRRGMNALFRSKQMVQGYWWPVFGRFLVLGLIGFAIMVPFMIAEIMLEGVENAGAIEILQIFQGVISMLFSAFAMVFGFLLYENLKAVKGELPFEKSGMGRKLKYLAVGFIGIFLIGALLVGIVFVSLSGARESAREAKRDADIRNLTSAVEFYYAENGTYPSSLEQAKGEFLQDIPRDPTTGLPYEYFVTRSGEGYILCADFQNRQEKCLNERGTWQVAP